jgi:predicted solute-binding protein
MKMMLKLTVLSFVFAMTVQAESQSPHASGQQPAATTQSTASQVAPKDRTAELIEKVNACVAQRGGKSAADVAAATRAISR